jgi:hypothetical protein
LHFVCEFNGTTEPTRPSYALPASLKSEERRRGKTPFQKHRLPAVGMSATGPKGRSFNSPTPCYAPSAHLRAAGTSPSWHNPYKD